MNKPVPDHSAVQTFYIRRDRAARINRDITVTYIIDYKNDRVDVGIAKCHKNDTFIKHNGRLVALGRLGKNPMSFPLSAFASNRYRDVAVGLRSFVVKN